jgi:hypothetical protein
MREQSEFYRAMLAALSHGTGGRAGAMDALAPLGVPTSFVATPSGANFHRANCAIVANRPGKVRTVKRDEIDGMRPCRICDPLATK